MPRPNVRLGVLIPEGSDFEILSNSLREAAQLAVSRASGAGSAMPEMTFIEEPMNASDIPDFEWGELDCVIGPVSSLQASRLLGDWPSGLRAAISPTADLPSLRELRQDQPFFRVCADGRSFAKALAAISLPDRPSRQPLLIYDASSRWWSEIARIAAMEIRAEGRRVAVAQFIPNRIHDDIFQAGRDPIALRRGTDAVYYLGGAMSGLGELIEWALKRSRTSLIFPSSLQPRIADFLQTTEFQIDGRVYTLNFQPPLVTERGNQHKAALEGSLGPNSSSNASQIFDSVLVAIDVANRLHMESRPRSHFRELLETASVHGCTGVVEFDSHGDRRDQGNWFFSVWRYGRFIDTRAGEPVPTSEVLSSPETLSIGLRPSQDRPKLGAEGKDEHSGDIQQPEYQFDIAISFAGTERDIAKTLVRAVQDAGFNVFYDEDNQADLWGKDQATYFDEIYRIKSRYCVIFVSREYLSRPWPNHERQAAVARAVLEQGNDYILQIMVDKVELPGIAPTIAFQSLNEDRSNLDKIIETLIEKLRNDLPNEG